MATRNIPLPVEKGYFLNLVACGAIWRRYFVIICRVRRWSVNSVQSISCLVPPQRLLTKQSGDGLHRGPVRFG